MIQGIERLPAAATGLMLKTRLPVVVIADVPGNCVWTLILCGAETTMKYLIIICAAISLLLTSGCSRRKPSNDAAAIAAEDAAMNEAVAKAQVTSADFVRAFHARAPGTKDFYIKKAYPVASGGEEHMWIKVTDEQDGIFQGIVANEAEHTQEVKIGQKVSVQIAEISDWKYQDGKKLIGGYTIRYFVDKMSPTERAAFLREAGFEL